MSPGLLSNALFRRDFPLGVDKRMCAAYCPLPANYCPAHNCPLPAAHRRTHVVRPQPNTVPPLTPPLTPPPLHPLSAQYRWRFAVENSGWLTLGRAALPRQLSP